MHPFDPQNSGPNGPSPLSPRQQRLLLVGIALVIVITQLLTSQLAHAQSVPAEPQEKFAQPEEKFVPGTARFDRGAILELRSEATIAGGEVKLRQLCRWSSDDESVFSAIGELIVLRLGPTTPYQTLTITQLKSLLDDAGVNVGSIRIVGAGRCTVARSDVQFDEGAALEAWMKNRKDGVAHTPASPEVAPDAAAEPGVAGTRRLRDLLATSLCDRLKLDPATIQLDFKTADARLLNLTEPQFSFDIQPLRVSDLGDVSWNVTLKGDHGAQRVTVNGHARAWQQQLVAARPLATKQTFRAGDFEPRRVLADRLPQDALLTPPQLLGQQASREIKPGTVLTARLIDPAELARPGQLVNVTISEGAVLIRTSGKCLDAGTFGQVVRIRNEATNEIYRATLVGPQAATLSPDPVVASHIETPVATVGAGE